ncbi:23792_t:CDS:2 [Racocetra persica]|uniref:23792_t:CDS:1 n=1 Tax=Racocetra persica TaxID=160502 RepID=A0ACA9LZW7_9GLOM|nr:23792_t:CDS:2 [Racocetra persica]
MKVILKLLLFSLLLQNNLTAYARYSQLAQYLKVPESKVPDLLLKQKFLIEGNMKNSLAKLDSTLKELDRLAEEHNVTTIVLSKNYEKNNIEIRLNHNENNQAFIDSAKKFNPIIFNNKEFFDSGEKDFIPLKKKEVRFNSFDSSNPLALRPIEKKVHAQPRRIDIPMFAGEGVHTGYSKCSAGFWAIFNKNLLLTTAGHCKDHAVPDKKGIVSFYHLSWDRVGPPTRIDDDDYIGPMVLQDFKDGNDRGFILKNTQKIASPAIRVNDSDFEIYHILGSLDIDESYIGASVCISGVTSRVTCGKILEVGAESTAYRNGSTITHTDTIQTSIISKPGDCGSPAFIFNLDTLPTVFLIGILVAGYGNESSTVLPMKKLLQENQTLLTILNVDEVLF